MPKEYIIILGKTPLELQKAVNEALRLEYELYGNLIFTPPYFYQTLTRQTGESNESHS